ncbi:MAG TPA: glycogen debranching protein GlgX [Kouleothrix sp.]|nr:glycogen debranching protein GlgX [Kouleothrix sp.]
MTQLWPGKPYPLGATWDGQGVNFALFSQHSTGVELCLFDTPTAQTERERIIMPEQTDNVWHVYIPGIQPGQVYGYRVYGPYDPEEGHRFTPGKLLVDPYAKAITGELIYNDVVYGYVVGNRYEDLMPDMRNSAPYVPRGVVIDPAFDWGDDRSPATPLHQSVIYEMHVKGFTKLHPDIPEHLRGTYAGLAQPAVIDYLKSLGVTAVELLPIHHHVDERFLNDLGKVNYWGYNTLGFFAPDARYSSTGSIGEQVPEFKAMVKAFHAAGIEVILDVVYNHTCEAGRLGPTLSFRGIDNLVYYRQPPDLLREYIDYTGCGNSLSMLHPRPLQLIMDSLRYWVTEMHVDGFRFDLASTLARGLHADARLSTFFDMIHQDPILSQTKLIAEPWDIGPGGYQVGNFPVLWAEWNGKYRDTMRCYWKGDAIPTAEIAYRLTGSSDLYKHNGRRPYASINFITAHDGFTMRDLVSYNHKHNEANGENNRDGENHNNSWNHGVEGPTDEPIINELRARQQRNLMATLLLSQGVPMLLAGDERSRTQYGNNNTYCQDNELNWIDWQLDDGGRTMLEFTRKLIRIRNAHPALHRRKFFQGRSIHGSNVQDIEWIRYDGQEMSDNEWSTSLAFCLGMQLNGPLMSDWDEHGNVIQDDTLLLLVNSAPEDVPFTLPGGPKSRWEMLLDTAQPEADGPTTTTPGQPYALRSRSLVLLRQIV